MTNLHWNYFLALEQDIIRLSRFIELDKDNFATFSPEITKIYLASASEFDIVSKNICLMYCEGEGDYDKLGGRYTCMKEKMHLFKEEVFIHKYDLSFKPFEDWSLGQAPAWWTKYNKVKHHRDSNYRDGNLGNCLNCMSGLFLACIEYSTYDKHVHEDGTVTEDFFLKEYLSRVLPDTDLFRLSGDNYYSNLIV